LSRKNDQAIILGGFAESERTIKITILCVKKGRVQLGIEVDGDVPVNRFEVWEQISAEVKRSIQNTGPSAFFTSLEAGYSFLQETNDWHLKRFPVSFVVEVILVDIKQDTSFYSIDPISSTAFKALTPVQFLTDLIYRKHPSGMKAQELVHDHPDIIPIEDFFRDSNSMEGGGYTQLLADADLIFGIVAV